MVRKMRALMMRVTARGAALIGRMLKQGEGPAAKHPRLPAVSKP